MRSCDTAQCRVINGMVCTVRQNHLRFPLQRRCKHRLFVFPGRLCFRFLFPLFPFISFVFSLSLCCSACAISIVLLCTAVTGCSFCKVSPPLLFSLSMARYVTPAPTASRQKQQQTATICKPRAALLSFLIHINTSDAIVAIGGFFYSRIEKEIPV